jgi:septal ring factor EnvC (AmiA/AmiB activator)
VRIPALIALLSVSSAPGDAVAPVQDDCLEYRNDYRLIRKDVLSQLSADSDNLASCEPLLQGAQEELQQAELDLKQAKKDLEALQEAALEQRAAIAELRAQKQVLEGHISNLEGMTCPEPTVGDQIVQGWEEVDAPVGLFAGYAIGMGTCIGVAYVFNQPAFVR